MKNLSPTRRHFVKSSVFGVLAISTTAACAKSIQPIVESELTEEKELFYRIFFRSFANKIQLV